MKLFSYYLVLSLIVSLIVSMLYAMGVITELKNGLWGVWAWYVIPWFIYWFVRLCIYMNKPSPSYNWGADVRDQGRW